jgi:hypothetical protein
LPLQHCRPTPLILVHSTALLLAFFPSLLVSVITISLFD